MLITLVITLYTSRVVLSALGENDFGLYNVIGGVVVLFSFLTSALTNATQRYINYNLGLGENGDVHKVFNVATIAHYTILLVVFVLAETIGLWFTETQLNIPSDRMDAARWVYQMTILATLFSIIVIPYRSSIIATERMSIFAYISIFEVVLRLFVAMSLPYYGSDILILYSGLITGVSILSFFSYRIICRKTIAFTRFKFVWDKVLYKEMMTFSSWYLFGGVTQVGSKQGVNILINIFYNVGVNAAVGIANQVSNAVFGFVSSFQTAFNPQIVKLYASGEHDNLLSLIFRSSKMSYYLLFIISLPVIVFCDRILSIWLVDVPQYTAVFTQLVIATSVFEALSAPLWTAIGATGHIKYYQIFVSLIIIFDIPLVYIALKLGASPTIAFVIYIFVSLFAYIYRVLYIRRYVKYSILDYLKKVIIPCLFVTLLSIPVSLIAYHYSDGIISTLVMILLLVMFTTMVIFSLGLNKGERLFVEDKVKSIISRVL